MSPRANPPAHSACSPYPQPKDGWKLVMSPVGDQWEAKCTPHHQLWLLIGAVAVPGSTFRTKTETDG